MQKQELLFNFESNKIDIPMRDLKNWIRLMAKLVLI